MTPREKIGLGVIIALFLLCGVLLALTITPLSSEVRDPADSYFVQQRMKILDSQKKQGP